MDEATTVSVRTSNKLASPLLTPLDCLLDAIEQHPESALTAINAPVPRTRKSLVGYLPPRNSFGSSGPAATMFISGELSTIPPWPWPRKRKSFTPLPRTAHGSCRPLRVNGDRRQNSVAIRKGSRQAVSKDRNRLLLRARVGGTVAAVTALPSLAKDISSHPISLNARSLHVAMKQRF